MNIKSVVISITGIALIVGMSAVGTYSFVSSGVYLPIERLIGLSYQPLTNYLPAVIWGLLSVLGVFGIVRNGSGGGGFTWLVTLCYLPSLLSFNSVNPLGIFGLEFTLGTKLSFYEALGMGVLIMVGYIVLNCMSIFLQTRRKFTKQGASPDDLEMASSQSHSLLLLVTIAVLVAVAMIALLSNGGELLIFSYVAGLSWNVILIGLGCTLMLVAYLYWMGSCRIGPVKAVRAEAAGDVEEEDALLERLARLDDKFDVGQLSGQEYHEHRAQIKERLVYLRSKRRGSTDS